MKHFTTQAMTNFWKATLAGMVLAVAAPSIASAACADLNNDGQVSIADALALSQCIASACPANVCGTGNALDCADIFDDNAITNADLAVMVDSLAGIKTLFPLCAGPGPTLAGCPGTVSLNSQTISSNIVWPAGCDIRINGTIFVNDGAVLTIQPGAVIKGVKGAPDPAALIFLPGSKINAQGTPASPIVFTSDQSPGSRAKGDWAGVMFNGRSTVNRPNCIANAEGIPTTYGGCDLTDSSGIARFVRAEYCGLEFTPNNELNTWTMNAIGSGTVMDFIQAHVGLDDGHEWFGGTSNHKYLIASGAADDGLDWQLGYTGSVQHALVLQKKDLTDPVNRDARGFEGDNSEFGNNDLPRSNPKMCNVTVVSDLSADNGGSDVGVFLRRGTAGQFANLIVAGFQDAGMELRDAATTQQACIDPSTLKGDLLIKNSIFWNNGTSFDSLTATEHCKRSTCFNASNVTNSFACDTNAQCVANDPAFPFCHVANGVCSPCDFYNLLVASQGVANANGSNALNPGQDMNWPTLGSLYNARPSGTLIPAADCTLISDQFEQTSYVGAFDPAGPITGWQSQPWLNYDPN